MGARTVQPPRRRRVFDWAARPGSAARPAIEGLERRVLLSAAATSATASATAALTQHRFTHADARLNDFTLQQQSLLESGFEAGSALAFLKLSNVPGDSQTPGHQGEIRVAAFSWGEDAAPTLTGGGTAAPAFHELHVVAPASNASPLLLDNLARGTHLPSAELSVVRQGDTPFDFYHLRLSDVIVSSYQVRPGGSSAGPAAGDLQEEFTLSFARADLRWTPTRADGTAGTPVTFAWDARQVPAAVQDFAPPQRPVLFDAAAVAGPPATAPMFLRLDGVRGQSQFPTHANEIEVLSFEWGADQQTGGRAGRALFHELHVVAAVSDASPRILNNALRDTLMRSARLAVLNTQPTPIDAYAIELENVKVASHQFTTATDGRLLEEFTLEFERVTLEHVARNADGTAAPPTRFHWDVAANRAALVAEAPVEPPAEPPTGAPEVVAVDAVANAVGVADYVVPQRPLLHAAVASPEVDLFLRVDGVSGESTVPGYLNHIPLHAFEWGLDRRSGGVGSIPEFNTLHVLAPVSSATPRLMQEMARGRHIQTVDLFVRRRGDQPMEFFRIRLADVVVDGYQAGVGPDGALREELALDFARATVTYTPVRPDGTPGAPVVVDHSLSRDGGTVRGYAPPQRPLLHESPAGGKSPQPMFLRLDGIPGEATDAAHADWVAVRTFEWGADPEFSTTAGVVRFHELHVVAPVSKATPLLADHLARGIAIPGASFAVGKTGGSPFDFYTLELSDVKVSSQQFTTLAGGQVLEEITLSYGAVDLEYVRQNADGSPGGTTLFSHDLATQGGRGADFAVPQRPALQAFDAAPAPLAGGDMFLKLGNVRGESTDAGHEDEIEVLGFEWGLDLPLSATGTVLAPPRFNELHLLARVSRATPPLMDLMVRATRTPLADFVVRRRDGARVEYFKVRLEDVVVSSYQAGGAGAASAGGSGSPHPVEEVTLSFSRYTVTYTPQDASGAAGTPVASTFNLRSSGGTVSEFAPPQPGLLLPAVQSAGGAVAPMFLRLDNIRGDAGSGAGAHAGEIPLRAFSWGADQTSSSTGGGGTGTGVTRFNELHLVTATSAASPRYLERLTRGQIIPTADFTLVRQDPGGPLDYYRLRLSDVQIGAYQVVPGPGGTMLEEVTLKFGDIDLTYTYGLAPDAIPPAVAQASFDHAFQKVRFTFSEDIGATLAKGDLAIALVDGQSRTAVDPAAVSFSYDAPSRTGTWWFPGLPGGVLPNGNYEATLAAGSVADAAGNVLVAAFTLPFYQLTGDINRDRSVNGTDFAILAGNFGKTGMTYSQGDLNGDGSVNGSDFAILAGAFGKSVPPPPASLASATATPAAQPPPARRAAVGSAPTKQMRAPRRVLPIARQPDATRRRILGPNRAKSPP